MNPPPPFSPSEERGARVFVCESRLPPPPPLQLLDRWSLSAIAARLDKRALQQQADTHRLFLVTEHWARLAEGRAGAGEAYARALAEEAEALGHEVRRKRERERIASERAWGTI